MIFGDRSLWRTVQLETLNKAQFPFSQGGINPSADPIGTGWAHRGNVGNSPALYFGRVVDAVPYTRTYKVQVEGISSTISCCDLSPTAILPIGAKSIVTYPPGTGVYVIWHPQATYGIIIGACPDYSTDARLGMSDYIVQGSRVGFGIDMVNAYPLWMSQRGNVTDWSASRPFDSVNIGEWGAMAETGLGFFLDPFLAFMRVDEATGLFLFYHDQLARLAGYNLQLRTLGSEREDLDDQNEYDSYEGYSSYSWEAKGRMFPGIHTARQYSALAQQKIIPVYSRFEPIVDDQQAFHRLMTFRGYLGQIESRFVVSPPDLGPHRYTSPHILPGLFEEHIAQTGRYTLRSLKSVTIGKTSAIAVPKRIRRPEDPSGDNPTNYRFAGVGGVGKQHRVQDTLSWPGPPYIWFSGEEGEILAASLLDQLAYQFNWEGLHPFHYHSRDWYVPEEWQLPYFSAGGVAPWFGMLAYEHRLPMPPSSLLYIDHRYNYARFYATEAFLHFAEDGGVVLTDGYGFELRTTQGNAYISLPGNLWILPGQNINIWAGWDAIIRAYNSADISASYGDVRLKAENNMQMLAGNSGCGGILLESRAVGVASNFYGVGQDATHTGIIMKCRQSQIAALASHIILSTNVYRYFGEMFFPESVPPPDSGEFMAGPIVLDAGGYGNFKGQILTYCNAFVRRIGQAAVDIFPNNSSGGNNKVNFFSRNRACISTPLYVAGRIMAGDSIWAKGHVLTLGKFGSKEGETVQKIQSTGTMDGEFSDIENFYATDCPNLVSATIDVGREVINLGQARWAEFSFRTNYQYKTIGMRLYELRWHQLARLSGQFLPRWIERPSWQTAKPIPFNATLPHPGRAEWTGENGVNTYILQDLNLFSPYYNMKAPRQPHMPSNLYEEGKMGPMAAVPMELWFPILPKL